MNGKAFLDLVIQMREAQREYFATRNSHVLSKAKTLEKRVDEIIAIYRNNLDKITPTQLDLFA